MKRMRIVDKSGSGERARTALRVSSSNARMNGGLVMPVRSGPGLGWLGEERSVGVEGDGDEGSAERSEVVVVVLRLKSSRWEESPLGESLKLYMEGQQLLTTRSRERRREPEVAMFWRERRAEMKKQAQILPE